MDAPERNVPDGRALAVVGELGTEVAGLADDWLGGGGQVGEAIPLRVGLMIGSWLHVVFRGVEGEFNECLDVDRDTVSSRDCALDGGAGARALGGGDLIAFSLLSSFRPFVLNITARLFLSSFTVAVGGSSPSSPSAYRAKAEVDRDPRDRLGGCHFPSSPFCIAGSNDGPKRTAIRFVCSGDPGRELCLSPPLDRTLCVGSRDGADDSSARERPDRDLRPGVEIGVWRDRPALFSPMKDRSLDRNVGSGSGEATRFREKRPLNPRPVADPSFGLMMGCDSCGRCVWRDGGASMGWADMSLG